jgi:hypothetical protein
VEGSQSIPGLGLNVGTLLNQQGHHVGFSPLGSHVQWGNVVLQDQNTPVKIFEQKNLPKI